MKKIFYSILLIMPIFFIGCGGGGSGDSAPASTTNETNTSTPSTGIALVLNLKTEVEPGDIYEARSTDASIDIDHDLVLNKRYVTLLKGKGIILKN